MSLLSERDRRTKTREPPSSDWIVLREISGYKKSPLEVRINSKSDTDYRRVEGKPPTVGNGILDGGSHSYIYHFIPKK